MSRSTRSTSKPLAPSTIRVHGKLKALPQYISFKHYPKCGVQARLSSESTNDSETITRKRGRIDPPSRRQSIDGKTLASSPIEASHNKSKKQAAIESTYPPEPDEIQAHSDYLNLECMRLISRELDNVVKDVLRRCDSGHIVDECVRFFDMFSPLDEDLEQRMEGGERQKNPDEASKRESSCVRMLFQPCRYPPTLLPMIIIKSHSNVVDRAMMIQGLVHDLSNQRSNNEKMEPPGREGNEQKGRPCVCVIRSFAELVEQGSLIAELLFQCISNDPNGKEFSMHIAHQRKRQKSHVLGGIGNGILFKSIFSYTQSLIDWCSCTEEFDSITVILEDPENLPSPDLDTFFTTLSSLRSNFGVPINIILMQSAPSGLEDRLSTLRQPSFFGCGKGDGGVMQRVLCMPLPEDQFEYFMNKLPSVNCIPTFLWCNEHLLEHIQTAFQQNDNSLVGIARRLKTELSNYFSLPGAFTALLDCHELVLPNWSRISWLVCQPLAKASPMTDQRDKTRQQLATRIILSLAFRRLYQAISSIESSESFSGGNLLRQLHQTNTILMKDFITGFDQLRDSLIMKANEFIILADEMSNDLEYNIRKTLMLDIKEWALETLTSQHTKLPIVPISRSAQPRKDVAKALVAMLPLDVNNSYARAMTIAFQCFQSRYLTLADWYEKYFDIVTNHPAMSSNESLFFAAVQELIHCGFIRKITSGQRKDETYEKIAIVWGR